LPRKQAVPPHAAPTPLYAIDFMSYLKPYPRGLTFFEALQQRRRNPDQQNQQNPVAFR
jgi:hypothetical protein